MLNFLSNSAFVNLRGRNKSTDMGKHGPCYHCGVTSEFCVEMGVFSTELLRSIHEMIHLMFFQCFCIQWIFLCACFP